MESTPIAQLETIFLILLVLVVLFATLARALRVPYPIVLVIAGILISFVPGIPRIRLQPDLIFLIMLPPLLFSAGWSLSWREFRQRFAAITMLAVGLVTFTMAVLCLTLHFVLPEFGWRAAFILGAVVAATDAVAATSLARKMGLPSHITELLEAESLLNDGTGLLAFQVGLAMLATGYTPTPLEAFGKLIFLTGAGVLVGLALAVFVTMLERWINDGPTEIVISLIVPYVAYLAAEKVQASGVIAVIACSMYMSRKSTDYMTPEVRLQAGGVWEALTFLLNGVVFILIGCQLPFVLSDVRGVRRQHLLLLGSAFSVFLFILRFVWLLGETHVSEWFRRWTATESSERLNLREITVVSWGGMRGVLSLAAAVSLPYVVAGGAPFHQRSMIIFLTFSVIVSTLVIQGLTLPALIRRLGLSGHKSASAEEYCARRVLLEAVLAHLSRRRSTERFGEEVVEDLVQRYRSRLEELPHRTRGGQQQMSARQRREALVAAIGVEREALLKLRDEETISDEVLRTLQRELDLSESRVHTGARGV